MFSPVPAPISTTRPRAPLRTARRRRRMPAISPSQRTGSYTRAKTRSHAADGGVVWSRVLAMSVTRPTYEGTHDADIARRGHLLPMALFGHFTKVRDAQPPQRQPS